MNIHILIPNRKIWKARAEEVLLPSSNGNICILNGHVPLLTAIEVGILKIKINNEWLSLWLIGGIAEISNNTLKILVYSSKESSIANMEKLFTNNCNFLEEKEILKTIQKLRTIKNISQFAV